MQNKLCITRHPLFPFFSLQFLSQKKKIRCFLYNSSGMETNWQITYTNRLQKQTTRRAISLMQCFWRTGFMVVVSSVVGLNFDLGQLQINSCSDWSHHTIRLHFNCMLHFSLVWEIFICKGFIYLFELYLRLCKCAYSLNLERLIVRLGLTVIYFQGVQNGTLPSKKKKTLKRPFKSGIS